MLDSFLDWLRGHSTTEILWIGLGLLGQSLFTMRFLVQWVASEKAKRSIVPIAFWYFSLAGGAVLFAYAVYRVDPVFIIGQGSGLVVYIRNLHLIRSHKRNEASMAGEATP